MKAEIHEPKFTPRRLTLLFETQLELDTFGALFNYTPVCNAIDPSGLDSDVIRRAVVTLGGSDTAEHQKICTTVTDHFHQYYSKPK